MSTPVNPGSPEQQAKKVKSKKIIQSQFRSFLLLAAIYSLIIHHVQKNRPVSPREAIKEGVAKKQEVKTSVNETNEAFDISGWDFRNASYIRDFNKPGTKNYGN